MPEDKGVGGAEVTDSGRIFAEHIRVDFGFDGAIQEEGRLLGFFLTKAEAMSPALKITESLLESLLHRQEKQNSLFR